MLNSHAGSSECMYCTNDGSPDTETSTAMLTAPWRDNFRRFRKEDDRRPNCDLIDRRRQRRFAEFNSGNDDAAAADEASAGAGGDRARLRCFGWRLAAAADVAAAADEAFARGASWCCSGLERATAADDFLCVDGCGTTAAAAATLLKLLKLLLLLLLLLMPLPLWLLLLLLPPVTKGLLALLLLLLLVTLKLLLMPLLLQLAAAEAAAVAVAAVAAVAAAAAASAAASAAANVPAWLSMLFDIRCGGSDLI
jgi:hypothetical protein